MPWGATNATGTIYYTLDGADRRAGGDAIATGAKPYTALILLETFTRIRARIKDGETWSALVDKPFDNLLCNPSPRITEISYHNAPVGAVAVDEYDFIELKNDGPTGIDLRGLLFDQGVTFAFSAQTTLTSPLTGQNITPPEKVRLEQMPRTTTARSESRIPLRQRRHRRRHERAVRL